MPPACLAATHAAVAPDSAPPLLPAAAGRAAASPVYIRADVERMAREKKST